MQIKDHVLLPRAGEIESVDEEFRSILNEERIASIVSLIPGEWLVSTSAPDANENRKVYQQFLLNRISHSGNFVKEAQHARQILI